jgi:SAM-dependent methyltransferase
MGVGCRTTKPIPRSARTGELSVRPGINDKLRDGDVDKWVGCFEGESREIYTERERIARTVGAKPGMVVADIGAGTGFLAELFAKDVQPGGRVYAVEIVPEFLDLIRARAKEQGLTNIEAVLCTDDSVELPAESIDLAFVCDTYHHFEYPRSTMASIRDALKTGGEVVIVEFIRDEAVSKAWILKHVRAGREEFIREIESDGFELIDGGEDVSYLTENYMIRFRKTE